MTTTYYGAVSEPIINPSAYSNIRFKLRKTIHQSIDLYRWRKNNISTLNYRNYDTVGSTNMGDIAITETAVELFSKYKSFDNPRFCNWGNLQQHIQSNILSSTDIIVVPGGGYFMLGKNGDLSDRVNNDLDLIQKKKLKLILFGVGINQPFEKSNEPSIKDKDGKIIEKILSYAQSISVRDKLSQKLLSKFTSKPVELIGDPALHLFDIKYRQSTSVWWANKKFTPNIGINFSFHGPTSEKLFKKNILLYLSALKKIQNITGCTFYYFVQYESEKIIPKLFAKKGVYSTIIFGSPEILIQGYANMDLHIGGMLHSCILAHSVDTPAIAIAYDIKHKGFLDLFNMSENCLSAYHFDEVLLVKKTIELLSNIEEFKDKIKITRKKLENTTYEHVKNSNLSILNNVSF